MTTIFYDDPEAYIEGWKHLTKFPLASGEYPPLIVDRVNVHSRHKPFHFKYFVLIPGTLYHKDHERVEDWCVKRGLRWYIDYDWAIWVEYYWWGFIDREIAISFQIDWG